MMNELTCSSWQQGLCAQFSLLLGIPSPWKFANICQASVFAHVRPAGSVCVLVTLTITMVKRSLAILNLTDV